MGLPAYDNRSIMADAGDVIVATQQPLASVFGIVTVNVVDISSSGGSIHGDGTQGPHIVHRRQGGGGGAQDDIMNKHYSELHNNSLPTDLWRNFTCQFSLELPSGFYKEILEPAICGSGIIGILLTVIVLCRKTMVTSTNCYLMALAVADLLYLLLLCSRIIVDKIDDCEFQLSDEKSLYSYFISIFMNIFLYTTIGVTVMLAVERYIAICQPMQAMTICSVKRARVIIIIIFLVAFILCIPKFFDMEITYQKVKGGETKLIMNWRTVYNEQVYVCLVEGFFVTVLPLCSLLALNIRLIIEIRRSTRYLQVCLGADWQLRSVVSREELKITMMLISVVIAFFFCQAPYMIYSLTFSIYRYNLVENDFLMTSASWQIIKHTVQSLLGFKSSCNFILYCWFSEKFWITFKRLFCLQHCLPRQNTHRANGCSNNSNNNNSNHAHHRPSCYITRETTC